jgi:hypothetical protein
MSKVPLGFIPQTLLVPVELILPSRKAPDGLINSVKFMQIRASIEHIGLIEPLSVTEANEASGHHTLLDGHLRLIALKDLGHKEVPCLVATDDEAYTYNSRINRLSTIQEHFMIRRAVERGVSVESLAKTLCVDVSHIMKKVSLLDGICPEAAELLKDRQFSVEISRVLRKMKPTRQVECVDLMILANNITVNYAEALLVATPVELLIDGKKLEKLAGVTPEQMARMEREMANLQGQYKQIEESYSNDVLELTLAQRYLSKILKNQLVEKFIKQHQPDILEQLLVIVEMTALDQ